MSSSNPPALPAKASGISIREVGRPTLLASTTAIGSSAATAPFSPIVAVRIATSSMVSNSARVALPPALRDSA